VGSGERQRMMAKPVLCDTCQGLRCRCCGVLQDWSDSWSPVACVTVKVKDQYSNELNAMAWLNKLQEHEDAENLSLFQKIDHIVVDGEKILPSIELLFESKESDSIYRIIEQVS
jgi:hypothetical protein